MARGIDYGMGRTNVDSATGIRYGVISIHSPMPEALDDIYTHGDDLSYKAWRDDLRKAVLSSLADLAGEYTHDSAAQRIADNAADDLVDAICEESEFDSSESVYRYERDGYVIETSPSLFCLMILKSPFKTRAGFCSPCVPGAGDLDNPSEDGEYAYCLGADWFENETAPYPIESV